MRTSPKTVVSSSRYVPGVHGAGCPAASGSSGAITMKWADSHRVGSRMTGTRSVRLSVSSEEPERGDTRIEGRVDPESYEMVGRPQVHDVVDERWLGRRRRRGRCRRRRISGSGWCRRAARTRTGALPLPRHPNRSRQAELDDIARGPQLPGRIRLPAAEEARVVVAWTGPLGRADVEGRLPRGVAGPRRRRSRQVPGLDDHHGQEDRERHSGSGQPVAARARTERDPFEFGHGGRAQSSPR